MRTHLGKQEISEGGNILPFNKSLRPDLRDELQRCEPGRLMDAERMSEIGFMTCSLSHDMRQSLSAIYANAEFLDRHDRGANMRTDLLLRDSRSSARDDGAHRLVTAIR